MSKSVSILTITNFNTSAGLKNLIKIIINQTYLNIIEWIIVEGSNNENKNNNSKLVNDIITKSKNQRFRIVYEDLGEIKPNGYLRNYANILAKGDIIMWMEENDFYFNNRVEICVGKLNTSSKMLLGSNNIYVHDLILRKTFKVNNPNVVQGGLTFKREYLQNHKYSDSEPFGEISSFTNNYSEPVELLLLEQSLVQIIHNENYFSKRQNILVALLDNLPGWVRLLDDVINVFIPNEYYNLYKKNYINSDYLDYDIVYFTGLHGIMWDPEDMKLGGSEQAVVHLSKHWVEMGKSVIVYGNFSTDKIVNGVVYSRCSNFKFEKKIKKLIVWRTPGIIFLMQMPFNADSIIVDFHDNFSYTLANFKSNPLLHVFLNKVNKFNFKSNYHLKSYEEFIGRKLNESEYNIIINGVRVKEFLNNNSNKRNPYRFCYCSSYDRGLETILEKMWPIIYQHEPRAELHIYYGMDHIYDMNFKNKLIRLMSQPGVTDHGRQPMEAVINEKYKSTFHLYLNNSVAEIDCISVRESLVTGCIPIISKFGVFAERHGLQFDWDPLNDNKCKIIAEDIVNKMRDFIFTDNARNQLMKSSTIVSWDTIAAKWLDNM